MIEKYLKSTSLSIAVLLLLAFLPIAHANATSPITFRLTYKGKVVPNSPVTVNHWSSGGSSEPLGYTDKNGSVSISLKEGRNDVSFASTGLESDFAASNNLTVIVESGAIKSVTSVFPKTGEIKIDSTNAYPVELDSPNFVFRVLYNGTPLSNVEIGSNFSYGAFVRNLTNNSGYGSIRVPDFSNGEIGEVRLMTRWRKLVALTSGIKDDTPEITMRLRIRAANGKLSSVVDEFGHEWTATSNGVYDITLSNPNLVFEVTQGDKLIKSGGLELQNGSNVTSLGTNVTGRNSLNVASGLSILKIYSFSDPSSIDIGAFFITTANGLVTRMLDFDGREVSVVGGVYQARMQLPNLRVRVSDGTNFLYNVSVGAKGYPKWLTPKPLQTIDLGVNTIHDFYNFYLPDGTWEIFSSASGSAFNSVSSSKYEVLIENSKVVRVTPQRSVDKAELTSGYVVLYPGTLKTTLDEAAKAWEDAKAQARAEARAKEEAQTRAELESKAKLDASKKKTTITCVKGKLTKKITAMNPKCPKGYKKK